MSKPAIETWHRLISERNVAALDEILADDAVFHSPVVHTPQKGKQLTKMYLSAAIMVLGNQDQVPEASVLGDPDPFLRVEFLQTELLRP